jgi:branched-chain amino acid transport system substrate-binding protein
MFHLLYDIAWRALTAHRSAMLKRRFQSSSFFLMPFVLLSLWGCATDTSPYLAPSPPLPLPASPAPHKEMVQRRPWDLWSPGRDLVGAKILDPRIVAADRLYVDGDLAKAAAEFASIKPIGLPENERAALAMRTAATQLSLDQPTRALATLSNFFRAESRSADAVGADFAVLFGYAYGRGKDLEQSLAWFSRAERTAPAGMLSARVAQGVRYFLEGVPAEKFDTLDAVWSGDEFIRRLIGEERYRRAQGGVVASGSRNERLWVSAAPSVEPVPLPLEGQTTTTVGVLLPLTGRYTALGTSTKNGIDLALQAQPDRNLISPVFKDTGEDPTQALTVAQELFTVDRAPIVIGPLLSEQVNAVTGVVRQNSAAMVSFSKRSDVELGDGIFRLGTTVESQVSSLAEAAVRKLGLKRIAIVAPSDIAGQEYTNSFAQKLRELGVEPAYQTSYSKDDLNALVAIAQEIEVIPLDGIFLPDSLTVASRLFSSIAPAVRGRIRPLGLATWDNPGLLANSRTVLSGAVFVSLFFTASSRPAVTTFTQSYFEQYRVKPDFLAAQGFDAATLVASAVAQQRLSGAPFAVALGSIGAYEGLTGTMTIDESGEIRRSFAVVELRDDTIAELVNPVTPAFVMRGNDVVETGNGIAAAPLATAREAASPADQVSGLVNQFEGTTKGY